MAFAQFAELGRFVQRTFGGCAVIPAKLKSWQYSSSTLGDAKFLTSPASVTPACKTYKVPPAALGSADGNKQGATPGVAFGQIVFGVVKSIRSRTSSTPARAAKYDFSSCLKLLFTCRSVVDMYIIPAAMAVSSSNARIESTSAIPFSLRRFIFCIPHPSLWLNLQISL